MMCCVVARYCAVSWNRFYDSYRTHTHTPVVLFKEMLRAMWLAIHILRIPKQIIHQMPGADRVWCCKSESQLHTTASHAQALLDCTAYVVFSFFQLRGGGKIPTGIVLTITVRLSVVEKKIKIGLWTVKSWSSRGRRSRLTEWVMWSFPINEKTRLTSFSRLCLSLLSPLVQG